MLKWWPLKKENIPGKLIFPEEQCTVYNSIDPLCSNIRSNILTCYSNFVLSIPQHFPTWKPYIVANLVTQFTRLYVMIYIGNKYEYPPDVMCFVDHQVMFVM